MLRDLASDNEINEYVPDTKTEKAKQLAEVRLTAYSTVYQTTI